MKFKEFTGTAGKDTQDSAMRNLVMADMLTAMPLLNILEWYPKFGGLVDKRKKATEANKDGVGMRVINNPNSGTTKDPKYADLEMKIFSGYFQTDVAYERQGPTLQESEHLMQAHEYAFSVARFLNDQFFNGDPSAASGDMKGLKKWIPASRIVSFGGANGKILPSGSAEADKSAQEEFLEEFNKAILKVPDASFMSMNVDMQARLETIGRRYISTTNVKDIYGSDQQVTMYRNIPIYNAGYKLDTDALVIPNNETCGTSSDCTSIYIARVGEGSAVSMATNVGLTVKSKDVDNWLVTSFEFDAGLGVFDDRAVLRFDGIRLQ